MNIEKINLLIKKDAPQLPINIGKTEIVLTCPICTATLHEDHHMEYCHECGQHILILRGGQYE